MLRLFLAFCKQARINYKRLSYIHPCWYVEYLAKSDFTPGSISNHISHLRTYYRLAGLDARPLHHYRLGLALRAVTMTIRRPSSTKLPVTPSILRRVVARLSTAPDSEGLVLAILIMFIGFLRQSSLAPPTVSAFDPSRHLTRADVTATDQGLAVNIKWSKTMQRASDMKTVLLPPTADPSICPLKAYTRYLQRAPPAPLPARAPLVAFSDGNPITTRYIARAWTRALQQEGLSTTAFSLHSLRKGGASFAYHDGDAKLNDVMAQGTWKSDAVRTYIKPQDGAPNTVHKAFSRL